MAKRDTGVGKNKRTHNHKTQKRLEIKKQRLAETASKRHPKK